MLFAKKLKIRVMDSKNLTTKEYTIKGTADLIQKQIDYEINRCQAYGMPCPRHLLLKQKHPVMVVLI